MPTHYPDPVTTQTFRKKQTTRRPKTAAKSVPYRQQYNFFFKEDIFGE